MKKFFKKYKILLVLVLGFLFFYNSPVLAQATPANNATCCVYYQKNMGGDPLWPCMKNADTLPEKEGEKDTCNTKWWENNEIPQRIDGISKEVGTSINCTPITGYSSLKFEYYYKDETEPGFPFFVESYLNTDRKTEYEAFKAVVEKEKQTLMSETPKKFCCISKKFDKCVVPSVKSGVDYTSLVDSAIKSKAQMQYFIESKDLPVWQNLDCGTGDYYHYNNGCDSKVPTLASFEDLTNVTPENLINYYQKVIFSDLKQDTNLGQTISKSKLCSFGVSNTATITDNEDRYKMPEGYDGPLPECAFDGSCGDVNDLLELAINIGEWLFKIIGSLAFVFFIYGGFSMVISFGNAEKFKKGQQVLVAAIIGMIIAFGAYAIVKFLLESLGVQESWTNLIFK